MKKYLLMAGALIAAGAATSAAEARTNISVGIGVPAPVYYEPAPVYYYPPAPVYYAPRPVYYGPSFVYYNSGWDRHRNYNWGYWHGSSYHEHDRGGWHH